MHSLLLNLLLMASLLAHTVLGCCWHHAHGDDCSEALAAVEPDCPHHGSHDDETHHHDAPSVRVGESHEHSAPCDELDCTFDRSAASKLVLPQPTALAQLLAPASDSAPPRRLLDRASEHDAPRVSAAALRALFQVWLT